MDFIQQQQQQQQQQHNPSNTPSKFKPFLQQQVVTTLQPTEAANTTQSSGGWNANQVGAGIVEGASDKNPAAVQTLIDSLFPVLSRSLQTIKEKTQVGDDSTPSVNAAMAFALGGGGIMDADMMNQHQYGDSMDIHHQDPNKAISPVSLTNPNGLSEHQTELINIAAGITALDENFMPMSRTQSVDDERPSTMGNNVDVSHQNDQQQKVFFASLYEHNVISTFLQRP